MLQAMTTGNDDVRRHPDYEAWSGNFITNVDITNVTLNLRACHLHILKMYRFS